MWRQVEKLAPLTGKNPVPEDKRKKFQFERDKFRAASFTRIPRRNRDGTSGETVSGHMKTAVQKIHELEGDERLQKLGGGSAVEVAIRRVHVRSDFVLKDNYIDPGKWQPLVYTFRHSFGLGEEPGSTFRAEV